MRALESFVWTFKLVETAKSLNSGGPVYDREGESSGDTSRGTVATGLASARRPSQRCSPWMLLELGDISGEI